MSVRRLRLPWFSLGMLLILIFSALFAPYISGHDPLEHEILSRFDPPAWLAGGSMEHIFGTDSLGRDVVSNVLYGLRVSILVGRVAVSSSVVLGCLTGLLE